MYIKDLSLHEEKEITLQGWAANKRESKGLVFIILRDGTGLCQCVVDANKVSEEIFAHAQKVSLETSLSITGTVVKDDRQVGGYELQATSVTIIGGSVDYPIAKKEHGVEFLMDHRHLWLRSQRQWAIMKIRNRIIYSIHQFFQEEGYIQMDAPLFTANAFLWRAFVSIAIGPIVW
jgi:asparaginyl-tRNA synthetase